jgi:hypothetical protein
MDDVLAVLSSMPPSVSPKDVRKFEQWAAEQ